MFKILQSGDISWEREFMQLGDNFPKWTKMVIFRRKDKSIVVDCYILITKCYKIR
jgi:hypothetical protein